MDPLSDILALMRPSCSGFRGIDAGGDWAVTFAPAEGMLCFAIETGACWLRLGGAAAPSRLESGDVVLLTGGGEVSLYSCETAEFLDAVTFLSSVPPGETALLNGGGDCRGIGGFFGLAGSHGRGLLAALPPLVHIHGEASKTALYAGVQRLMSELREPRPGGALIANHLAQALLIEALRAHLDSAVTNQSWLAALSVPTLRRAMTAMHADVARRWTLRDLASTAGMSRSSFAATFERVTGETPIAYLTGWRMFLAADRPGDHGRPGWARAVRRRQRSGAGIPAFLLRPDRLGPAA